jgi:hypothetical protein
MKVSNYYKDGEEKYWKAMSSEYSYEKEEGLYQANRLISELQNNGFAVDELPERMERVRADWEKGLGDPQSFNEWNNHFTAAITKATEEAA